MNNISLKQAIEIMDARTSVCKHLRCGEVWKVIRTRVKDIPVRTKCSVCERAKRKGEKHA